MLDELKSFLKVLLLAVIVIIGITVFSTVLDFFFPKDTSPKDIKTEIIDKEYEYGAIVRFGTYYTGELTEDGKEEIAPIEWRIAGSTDDNSKVLLVTNHAIDAQPYNNSEKPINWCDCSLRQWLNNDFYNIAFSDEDKKYIALSETRYYVGEGSKKDTVNDYVFIPDFYFSSLNDESGISECTPTKLAYEHGAVSWTSAQGRHLSTREINIKNGSDYNDSAHCYYWFQGDEDDICRAARLSVGQGNFRTIHSIVPEPNDMSIGVRPEIWINMS